MRGRGKAQGTYRGDLFAGANNLYSSAPGLPCKKHPSSSPVGVCAYCLKDRLLKLVCSDCGEHRLSSCSCSEISNRNSCSVEVGSVGRISFLIENEKPIKNILDKSEDVVVLKRSNSTCAETKRSGGFWKIGRLFRKSRDGGERSSVAGGCDDEKSEMWVVDYMGVSRSRSLCSFRETNLYGSEDYLPVSAARSSISAARSSGVIGGMALDSGRRSGFSETEPRKSGFSYNSEAEPRKSGFDDHEMRTGPAELDSGFTDLKFDFLESKTAVKSCRQYENGNVSCRRDRKSFKGWGWIFNKHHNSTSARKKDDVTFNPRHR